jgi:AcrR family transcriptional regulator
MNFQSVVTYHLLLAHSTRYECAKTMVKSRGKLALEQPDTARGTNAPDARSHEGRRSQAERRDQSKARLLRAAYALIAERGFRATSFQAIAERAGYSPSLVSHRFGSREGLFSELVRRMVNKWGADVRDVKVESRTGIAALVATADAHRQALERSPEGVRAMYMLLFESLIEAPELRREFALLDARLRRGTERLLREGIPERQVRGDIDVAAYTTLFLAILRGITLQWMVDPDAVELTRVYAAFEELLERGLR